MNILVDGEKLSKLLGNLSALCGMDLCVQSGDGRKLCAGETRSPFCAQVQSSAAGCALCRDCAARICAEWEAKPCRCRAGALGLALPIRWEEFPEPPAYLIARPFRDDAAPERRWSEPAADAPEETAALRRAYLRLRSFSPEAQIALGEALEALADYIRLKGLILPAAESDSQRLRRFLDEHYTEKLSLASISAQLRIGRTRLCALAKELSGGQTLSAMIAQRRIDAAKALLARSDRPVSAIAEAVGISDYNYFSKIFHASVGVSPSEFRKRSRIDLDNMV